MRQAINNLQSTHSGFGFVSQDNVFKICDQPHPIVVRQMIKECQAGDIDGALARIGALWDKGYSAVDIVTTIFRVVKGMEELPEYTKLEFIRVSPPPWKASRIRRRMILILILMSTLRRSGGHT